MSLRIKEAGISIAIITLAALPASAAEETLNFRLVVTDTETGEHTDPAIEGFALGAVKSVGVAMLEDGRIAYKEFVRIDMAGDGAPTRQPGYSNYKFENGDSLQVAFTAGAVEGGYTVEYEVLSGTGAYSNATGTGRLDLVPTEWSDASLFEGSITVSTP